MRGVASLERRLLVERVGLVEGGPAVVLAAPRHGHVLRREVVFRLGPGQGQPLQCPAEFLQAAVAGVEARHLAQNNLSTMVHNVCTER